MTLKQHFKSFSNILYRKVTSQHCGKEFTARTTNTLYCSHSCNSAAFKQKERTRRVKQSNKKTQRLKNQPFEELKAKVFMSITDTCKLIGISRRTVFRMIELGDLITA